MKLRFMLTALTIGAGLFLPVQTPAVAKTNYKAHKFKKYSYHRIKPGKVKGHAGPKHVTPKHVAPKRTAHS